MKTAGPRQDPAVICYALDGLVGIIGQHLHQFLAGKEDAALHRTDRQVQFVSNFFVLVSLGMHFEGQTVLVGEPANVFADLLHGKL